MLVQRYLASWFICGLRRAYECGGVGGVRHQNRGVCGTTITSAVWNRGVCLLSPWGLQRHLHIVAIVSGAGSGEDSDAREKVKHHTEWGSEGKEVFLWLFCFQEGRRCVVQTQGLSNTLET
jgi:hypothetical protein